MICEKCNKNIDYDAKFCYFCGYKIEKKSEEVEIYTNSKLKGIVFRIIAIVLAYFGFVANAPATPETEKGVRILFSIMPAIWSLIAVVALFFYKLDEKKVIEINEELANLKMKK